MLQVMHHAVPVDTAGVSLNYKLDSGLNDPRVLFPGMACAAVAILVGGLAHIENQNHLKRQKAAAATAAASATAEGKGVIGQDLESPEVGDPVVVTEGTMGEAGLKLNRQEFFSVDNPQRWDVACGM